MASIELDDLETGRMPGIEPIVGACMVQAAIICLEDGDHTNGVELDVEGVFGERVDLQWKPLSNPEQARRSWDPDDATEQGAYGIAALLIYRFTEYTVVERAMKWIGAHRSTGFDYWLDRKDANGTDFQLFGKARLEVSGIRKGGKRDVAARVRRKALQTTQSDSLEIPAYVTVVEFSMPYVKVLRRWKT